MIRIATAVGVAIAAHLATVLLRSMSRRLLASRFRSEAKIVTITGFATSLIVFAIYFAAIGFLLSELGIPLTTYLASASIIGLAVSFGSQGIVQDVITGLTVVSTDLIDVGDLVDLGGQVGVIERVGMRFTVLVNFGGARVFVPNRAIANVINYPQGYSCAYVDVTLPAAPNHQDELMGTLSDLAEGAYQQFPGILLLPPRVEAPAETIAGDRYARIEFRIWPGQGKILESSVKARIARRLKQLDPTYADSMITVHYRSERKDAPAHRTLPRPAVLADRPTAPSRDLVG